MIRSSTEFREAIIAAGLEPPDRIVPGKIYRFPGIGKGSTNRAGWCRLFDDQMGGDYGDWSSGLSERWFSNKEAKIIAGGQDAVRRHLAKERAKAEKKRQARHARAAKRAAEVWTAATPVPSNFLYLRRKGIKPHSARLSGRSLILPIVDFDDKLMSLQFISSYGRKRLQAGGRKSGCYIRVSGNVTSVSRIYICEGWATGCTIAEHQHPGLVLAAIDAGNLESVAVSARHRWPSAEIFIVADDDRMTYGNPGVTKAQLAAEMAEAQVLIPTWPEGAPQNLTDYNDLTQWLKQVKHD